MKRICKRCRRVWPLEDFCRKNKGQIKLYSTICNQCWKENPIRCQQILRGIIKEDHNESMFWEKSIKLSFSPRETAYRKLRREELFGNWLKILPLNPQCEICRKNLEYASGKIGTNVIFDHKTSDIFIRTAPTSWLSTHKPSKENIEIWKSCDFGILCSRCNLSLPTKKRKEWFYRIKDYILGD